MTSNADLEPARSLSRRLWNWLLKKVHCSGERSLPELDPNMLPDELKRDLGFLDGRR